MCNGRGRLKKPKKKPHDFRTNWEMNYVVTAATSKQIDLIIKVLLRAVSKLGLSVGGATKPCGKG